MRIKCELRITDEYGSDLRSYDHYLSSSENKAILFNCSVLLIRSYVTVTDTQPELIRSN